MFLVSDAGRLGLDSQPRKLLLYVLRVLIRQNLEVRAVSCVLGCLFYWVANYFAFASFVLASYFAYIYLISD